jgi:hypothetical protein
VGKMLIRWGKILLRGEKTIVKVLEPLCKIMIKMFCKSFVLNKLSVFLRDSEKEVKIRDWRKYL